MKRNQFETKKNHSLSHQLIKAGRLINKKGLSNAQEAFNLPGLKQTHLNLFPYIDFKGTSISDLARRKKVSKQAISKLVQEMVQMKLLALKNDPDDSRSKLVFFKTKGPFAIENGLESLLEIDKELSKLLSNKKYNSIIKNLAEVIEHLSDNEDS